MRSDDDDMLILLGRTVECLAILYAKYGYDRDKLVLLVDMAVRNAEVLAHHA